MVSVMACRKLMVGQGFMKGLRGESRWGSKDVDLAPLSQSWVAHGGWE
jgi:hypothetical protein